MRTVYYLEILIFIFSLNSNSTSTASLSPSSPSPSPSTSTSSDLIPLDSSDFSLSSNDYGFFSLSPSGSFDDLFNLPKTARINRPPNIIIFRSTGARSRRGREDAVIKDDFDLEAQLIPSSSRSNGNGSVELFKKILCLAFQCNCRRLVVALVCCTCCLIHALFFSLLLCW